MSAVRLVRPDSLDEALALLADPDSVPVAGGVGLTLERQETRRLPASTLVAIDRLEPLLGSTVDGSRIVIGAAERLEDIAADAALEAEWPVVTEAVRSVATARVRRVVTIGGNLAAIDPAHDPAAGLVAVGASVRLAGPNARVVALQDLVGPQRVPLGDDELITAIELPRAQPGTGSAYVKYLVRRVWEYACVAVAAVVRLDGSGAVEDARLVLGSVGPTVIPVSSRDAVGEPFGDAVVDRLAARAANLADPVSDVRGSAEYKRRMVGVHARRALLAAAERAQGAGHD